MLRCTSGMAFLLASVASSLILVPAASGRGAAAPESNCTGDDSKCRKRFGAASCKGDAGVTALVAQKEMIAFALNLVGFRTRVAPSYVRWSQIPDAACYPTPPDVTEDRWPTGWRIFRSFGAS